MDSSDSAIELENKLKTYIANIEKTLISELNRCRASSFYEPLLHALDGGKRIRPLILVLSTECVGNKGMNPFPLSIVMELCHVGSLIHDDLIDRETLRRGKSSFHIKFGQPIAILSADYILGMVFEVVSMYNNPRINNEIASTVFKMCEGEINDVMVVSSPDKLNLNSYLNIIENKTASLFRTSAKVGAILGGGEELEIKALSDYGLLLGFSYQIKDDILDFGEKNSGVNLSKTAQDEILTQLKSLAEIYSQKAVECLKILKDTKAKEHLIELAKFAAMRHF